MNPASLLTGPVVESETLPWIPLGPGESFKPLRFLSGDRGRVLLLRLLPGTTVARHRHLGEVHAFNLSGHRQLDTGEVVGPGGYVYEPPGNVDSWTAVGDEPVVVLITAFGPMEYLAPDGSVVANVPTTMQSVSGQQVRVAPEVNAAATTLTLTPVGAAVPEQGAPQFIGDAGTTVAGVLIGCAIGFLIGLIFAIVGAIPGCIIGGIIGGIAGANQP